MVLLKSLALSSLAALASAKSAVLDLIPSNFDKVVLQSGKPTLVEFFAPWCGHCKNLAPVYEELAIAFEFAQDKVQIAKVDADAERELGKRFGIQGFPTLKWFDGKSDTPEDYQGGRDLDSLSDFITQKTSMRPRKKYVPPSNVVMLNDQSFAAEIGGDKSVLVAFTAPWCGHCKKLAPLWETLANDFELDSDVIIAKVDCESENSKAIASSQGITSYPTIKWFPKGSTKPINYEGARTETDFIAFVNERAGTHRAPGGGVSAQAGLVNSLNAVVARLSEGGELETLAAEAQALAEKVEDEAEKKAAQYYIRVFGKLAKAEGFVAKELARLEDILAKDGLAREKRDELTVKTNILRQFAAKPIAKEKAGEKDEL